MTGAALMSMALVAVAQGRLSAAELGLVINTADPYSVTAGETFARRRGIPAANVLRLVLPLRASLTVAEFEALNEQDGRSAFSRKFAPEAARPPSSLPTSTTPGRGPLPSWASARP